MALNETMLTNLCNEIEEGLDEQSACGEVGFSWSLLMAMMEQGKTEQMHRNLGGKPRKTYDDSYEVWVRVSRAKARARKFYSGVLRQAAKEGDWKAAQFWLSKNNPAVYGSTGSSTAEALDEPTPRRGIEG